MAFELAVLLAAHNVDLHLAMTALAAKCVTLAPEQELGNRFSDRELRAIPPLGSEYGMKTLLQTAGVDAKPS